MPDNYVDIDADKLRDHLLDVAGSAAFSGFPAAFLDVMDIEQAQGQKLLDYAERLGVDLDRFVINRP